MPPSPKVQLQLVGVPVDEVGEEPRQRRACRWSALPREIAVDGRRIAAAAADRRRGRRPCRSRRSGPSPSPTPRWSTSCAVLTRAGADLGRRKGRGWPT